MDEQEKQRLITTSDARLLIATAQQAIQRAQKSEVTDEALANLVWAMEFVAEVVSRLLADAERNKWIDQIESDANKGALS